MSDIFVGRQPIYNQNLDVYGYELLFRNSENNAASFGELTADAATSTIIANSFLEFGLETLVGKQLAFINLTEKFFLEEDALPISPEQVILEILEDIPVTPELVAAVKRLSAQGFTIALDDYIYNSDHKELLEIVDIIKIDIMQLTAQELVEHVNIFKPYKAKLLAEKIETRDEFESCVELGFDYFQGYFLSRPNIVSGTSLPTNKMAALNLLSVLQDDSSETADLENIISNDVAISYKLLKCINSAFYSMPHKVESIKQAIVFLGRKQLGSLASMLALTNADDIPEELIRLTMTRAKMCELLAVSVGIKSTEAYFTVGLLSALDLIMGRELAELIKSLPLSEEIIAALLEREGRLGEALSCVIAYEFSDFQNSVFGDVQPNDIVSANVESLNWANQVITAA